MQNHESISFNSACEFRTPYTLLIKQFNISEDMQYKRKKKLKRFRARRCNKNGLLSGFNSPSKTFSIQYDIAAYIYRLFGWRLHEVFRFSDRLYSLTVFSLKIVSFYMGGVSALAVNRDAVFDKAR